MLRGQEPTPQGATDWALPDCMEAVTSSGRPGILSHPARMRRRQLGDYLLRIVDRDLPEDGTTVRRPETLRRWLNAYAPASSTIMAYSSRTIWCAIRHPSRPAGSPRRRARSCRIDDRSPPPRPVGSRVAQSRSRATSSTPSQSNGSTAPPTNAPSLWSTKPPRRHRPSRSSKSWPA